MAKVKHNPDAPRLIEEGINSLEPFARDICQRLRQIILSADPELIEDWKWGPNYYLNGMVCGFWGFKKHVNLVFFQGALLKDPKKLLLANEGTQHNRHLKFTHIGQVNDEDILELLFEAIDNARQGLKLALPAKDTPTDIPADVELAFKKANVLPGFEKMSYSHRKEYLLWINSAKKEETRQNRIQKAITMLGERKTLFDQYKK